MYASDFLKGKTSSGGGSSKTVNPGMSDKWRSNLTAGAIGAIGGLSYAYFHKKSFLAWGIGVGVTTAFISNFIISKSE